MDIDKVIKDGKEFGFTRKQIKYILDLIMSLHPYLDKKDKKY